MGSIALRSKNKQQLKLAKSEKSKKFKSVDTADSIGPGDSTNVNASKSSKDKVKSSEISSMETEKTKQVHF